LNELYFENGTERKSGGDTDIARGGPRGREDVVFQMVEAIRVK